MSGRETRRIVELEAELRAVRSQLREAADLLQRAQRRGAIECDATLWDDMQAFIEQHHRG